MTEGQKATVLDHILTADAATQLRIAETIRKYPDTPLYDVTNPVGPDAVSWGDTYVESMKYRDYADYLLALSWFYAEVRPVNAMSLLLNAKLEVIKNGTVTHDFWTCLEAQL